MTREALDFRHTVLLLLYHSGYCTLNILFTLALNRWQETGRDSNSSRRDVRDTGRTGLRNKQANAKLEMGNVLELFGEHKATERGELLSLTEQTIIKKRAP